MTERIRLTTADGSHSIFVPALNETYHSRHGALQESRHVFIEMGLKDLAQRKKRIWILEAGFGTGLNALLTAIEAEELQLEVEYWTVEAHPLSANELEGLNYAELTQANDAEALWRSIHAARWGEMEVVSPHFSIHKVHGALETVDLPGEMDLVYFDAFAPEKQPELWTADVFEKIHGLMANSGLLTTYCAKGSVRRTLQAVGFDVRRVQGPPGKREMILASK